MLDDGDGGVGLGVELADQLPAGVEVDDVVVAEFFALKLLGGGDALAAAVDVEGGLLVGVFAVAEGLGEGVDDADGWRQDFLLEDGGAGGGGDGFEGGGDGGVVGGGGGEGCFGEAPAGVAGEAAGVGGEFVGEAGVVGGGGDDGDVFEVLGGGADHGGAADVDVLDDLGELATPGFWAVFSKA